MDLIALIVTGGLAGWIAGRLLRGEGYGFVINVAVGVVGGIVGGKLLALFRVTPDGWLIELVVGGRGGPAARPDQPGPPRGAKRRLTRRACSAPMAQAPLDRSARGHIFMGAGVPTRDHPPPGDAHASRLVREQRRGGRRPAAR